MAPFLQGQGKPDRVGSAGTGSASSQSPDLAETSSASASPSSELLQRWYLEHIVKRYQSGGGSVGTAGEDHPEEERARKLRKTSSGEVAEEETNGNGTASTSVLDLSSQVNLTYN